MPTRRDYYERLTFEQQDKYRNEYLRQNDKPPFEEFLNGKCISMKQFISNGFVFDLSSDGYFYWYNLSNGNLCLPEWVNMYYNDVNTSDSENILIKNGCRSIQLPNAFADAIAEDMLLSNLITNYVIFRDEDAKRIVFEADLI